MKTVRINDFDSLLSSRLNHMISLTDKKFCGVIFYLYGKHSYILLFILWIFYLNFSFEPGSTVTPLALISKTIWNALWHHLQCIFTENQPKTETIEIGNHNRQGNHGRFDLTAKSLFQMYRENRTKKIFETLLRDLEDAVWYWGIWR